MLSSLTAWRRRIGAQTPNGTLVAMKPVVEEMGLDWEGLRQRIARNPVLAKGACEIQVPSADGPQAMTALPLSRLSFWLAACVGEFPIQVPGDVALEVSP